MGGRGHDEGTAGTHPATAAGRTPLPDAELDVTVVMPYFNPGDRLRDTVERAVKVLRASGASFEVVTVSDGSTDGSEETLDGVAPDVVTRVVLPSRGGKGQAVRAGLERGRGRYLGFIDADGDVPPELLGDFVEVVRTQHPDVVLGSKRHRHSEVVYPPARRLYSWGYQQLVRLLFHLDVRDTQAGIKLVRRDVLIDVLPSMIEQGYAFDLELLVLARFFGYRHLVEAPVRIGLRFTSTVSLKVVGEMLRDTMAIWWRLRVRHAYGTLPRRPGPERVVGTGPGPVATDHFPPAP
ncbi:MAG TPA: glycosyltransferase [Acidimicrobiales bacterium]|nr:glycosyltransferase [Acidimicrobiales bacterium]